MRALLDVNVLIALLDRDLLALAVERGGRFVTFDRSVPTNAAVGAGPHHLLVL